MSNEQLSSLLQEILAEAMQLGMKMIAEDHEQWLDSKAIHYESVVHSVRNLSTAVERLINEFNLDIEVGTVLPMLSSMEESLKYIRDEGVGIDEQQLDRNVS